MNSKDEDEAFKDEDEAFEIEMSAHPWGYGQQRKEDFEFAMAAIRMHGLWNEALVIMNEIQRLKAELEEVRKKSCPTNTSKTD